MRNLGIRDLLDVNFGEKFKYEDQEYRLVNTSNGIVIERQYVRATSTGGPEIDWADDVPSEYLLDMIEHPEKISYYHVWTKNDLVAAEIMNDFLLCSAELLERTNSDEVIAKSERGEILARLDSRAFLPLKIGETVKISDILKWGEKEGLEADIVDTGEELMDGGLI